jgi:fructose-1-phosphate kinase PfkB-like protein
MRSGVSAGPDLIKPNVAEAERLLQRSLPDEEAVVQAARALVARGIETAIISMGARGAICATARQTWRVRPPAVKKQSTVGAGDSMVAGVAVALARGGDIETALKLGTAAGAATAASAGTGLGTAEDVMKLRDGVELEGLP